MRRAASLGALAFVGIIILISGGRRSFDNPHGTASSLSVEENQYYARSTALTFEPEPTDRQHQCVTIVALQHGGGADGVDMEAAAAATARSLFGSSAKEIQLLFMGQSGSIEQVLLASSVPMPQPDLVRTLQEIPMWDPFTVADSAIDMSTCFLYSVVHVGDSFTSTLHEQAAWVMRARHRVAAVSTFHLGKDGAPISWNPFDETAQAAPDGSASLLQRYWPVDRREVRALSRLSPGAVFSTAALKQARVSPLHSLRAACGADVALVSTWLHWSVHRIGYTAVRHFVCLPRADTCIVDNQRISVFCAPRRALPAKRLRRRDSPERPDARDPPFERRRVGRSAARDPRLLAHEASSPAAPHRL